MICASSMNATPPLTFLQPKLLPVLERIKSAYLVWTEYHQNLPKIHRYSLGGRVDTLFIEMIEATAQAAFMARAEKEPWVRPRDPQTRRAQIAFDGFMGIEIA